MEDSLAFLIEPTLPVISLLILLAALRIFAAAEWARPVAAWLRGVPPAKTRLTRVHEVGLNC